MQDFLWIDSQEKTHGECENHHLEEGGGCEAEGHVEDCPYTSEGWYIRGKYAFWFFPLKNEGIG